MRIISGSKRWIDDPIFAEAVAEADTGLTLDDVRGYLNPANSFLMVVSGEVVGFLGYVQATMPDTREYILMERYLYVREANRGSLAAARLIKALVDEGARRECQAVLAGSSLNCNETARRLYEGLGFKTNYTFRKELQCVTQSPPS